MLTTELFRFPPTRSENELRLLYSMALIRFVNGLVEKEQGANAKSVALLAESLNLPRVLVDLRHAATHKTLPSLPALRHGCLSALTWIDQAYVNLVQHFLSSAHLQVLAQAGTPGGRCENGGTLSIESIRNIGEI